MLIFREGFREPSCPNGRGSLQIRKAGVAENGQQPRKAKGPSRGGWNLRKQRERASAVKFFGGRGLSPINPRWPISPLCN